MDVISGITKFCWSFFRRHVLRETPLDTTYDGILTHELNRIENESRCKTAIVLLELQESRHIKPFSAFKIENAPGKKIPISNSFRIAYIFKILDQKCIVIMAAPRDRVQGRKAATPPRPT